MNSDFSRIAQPHPNTADAAVEGGNANRRDFVKAIGASLLVASAGSASTLAQTTTVTCTKKGGKTTPAQDNLGNVYSVDTTGALFFAQDIARNGEEYWSHFGATTKSAIGSGWNFERVFSGGNGVIYAIDNLGNLYFYKDGFRNGSSFWVPGSGNIIGKKFKFIIVLLCALQNGRCPFFGLATPVPV